jgi:integrative and conjugative element protein (TIGR02256 family)
METLYKEISAFGITETGGVLLGHHEHSVVHVDKVILSGSKAIHNTIYFEADHEYVEMEIDLAYANSDGKIRYIGEWHSHPQKYPTPSTKDLDSIRKISLNTREGYDPILLIIGAVGLTRENFLKQSIVIFPDKESNEMRELHVKK